VRPVSAWFALTAVLAVVATACGAVARDQTTPQAVPSSPIPAASRAALLPAASPSSESSASIEMQAAADAAMREATARLSLPAGAGDARVQRVEPRQWPDSSLGCPSQGVQYLQVVTPGYLVVVSAAGKQLEYHADARGRVVFCQEL
jgi:hypothetical protein